MGYIAAFELVFNKLLTLTQRKSLALRRQREAIEEKRARLELAVKAIQRAEYVVAVNGQSSWELLREA